MFNFFKKKEKENSSVLSLDIGTEYAKCLVINYPKQEGAPGEITGCSKIRQKLGDMQSGAITDIGGVIENCKKAIDEAIEMAGIKPHQVIMGIAGELVKGATSVITYDRSDPTSQITFAELKNIVHKVQWKAFDQVRSQLAWETGYPEIDVKLVNAAIVDVRIDSYKIQNPIGFQGKEISISIFNAFAPLVHLGALQTVAEELNLDVLAISAEPYAVARCVEGDDKNMSAIFIDIGGGTTDIAVVRDGGVEGTKMFALGGRSFTKRLSQVLNISFEEAEKIKIAYSNKRLDKAATLKIRDAIENDVEVWISGVEMTLKDFYNLDILPSDILLCGGGSKLPEITKYLEGSSWWKDLPFAKRPRVKFIKPEDVSGLVDLTKLLKSQQDITPMCLGSLAMQMTSEDEIVGKVLRKVVRLMQV
jgi:cell division protein FtsA